MKHEVPNQELARPSGVGAQTVLGAVGKGLLLGGASFGVAAMVATPWLFIPAGVLSVASGVIFIVRGALAEHAGLASGSRNARIGLGSEVHDSAKVEPGAVIEMGRRLARTRRRAPSFAVKDRGSCSEYQHDAPPLIGWELPLAC